MCNPTFSPRKRCDECKAKKAKLFAAQMAVFESGEFESEDPSGCVASQGGIASEGVGTGGDFSFTLDGAPFVPCGLPAIMFASPGSSADDVVQEFPMVGQSPNGSACPMVAISPIRTVVSPFESPVQPRCAFVDDEVLVDKAPEFVTHTRTQSV